MLFPLWEDHILHSESRSPMTAPELSPRWQSQSTDILVEVYQTDRKDEEIILSAIIIAGEPIPDDTPRYLFPARLERVGWSTLLLIAARENLSDPLLKLLIANPRIRIDQPLLLPEESRFQLGFNHSGVLLEGSFPLYRYRQYFHHFLEYHSARSLGRPKPEFSGVRRR